MLKVIFLKYFCRNIHIKTFSLEVVDVSYTTNYTHIHYIHSKVPGIVTFTAYVKHITYAMSLKKHHCRNNCFSPTSYKLTCLGCHSQFSSTCYFSSFKSSHMDLLREMHFNFVCFGCHNAFKGSKQIIKPTPKKQSTAPSVGNDNNASCVIKGTPNGSLYMISDESSISRDTISLDQISEIITGAFAKNVTDTKIEFETLKTFIQQSSTKTESSIDKLVTTERHKSTTDSISNLLDENFMKIENILKEKPANSSENDIQRTKQIISTNQKDQDDLIQILANTEKRTWDSMDILNKTLGEHTAQISAIRTKIALGTCSPTDDDSLLTPNLQQQHRNLINMNDSTTLAPNHSELMEVQHENKSCETLDTIIFKLNEQSEKIEFIKNKLSDDKLVGGNLSVTDNRSKEAKTQKKYNNNNENAENPRTKKTKKRQKSNLSDAQPESNVSKTSITSTQRTKSTQIHRGTRSQIYDETYEPNDHSQMEANGWRTVAQRKIPHRQRLPSSETKAIFWSKVDAHYDTVKATNYIIGKGIANREDFTLTLMTNSKVTGNTYVSFKIDILANKYDDLLNSTQWPWRSYVRKFHNVKRKSEKNSRFF